MSTNTELIISVLERFENTSRDTIEQVVSFGAMYHGALFAIGVGLSILSVWWFCKAFKREGEVELFLGLALFVLGICLMFENIVWIKAVFYPNFYFLDYMINRLG